VDVTNTCYYFLEKCKASEILQLTQLDKLILLLSSSFHDMNHPGHNNLFEINSRAYLAMTYNDKSVLENYHLYLFFDLLTHEALDIFEKFKIDEMKKIRKMFISNIIATDMFNHRNELKKLKDISGQKDKYVENKELILSQLMHFSDISNASKPFNIYQKWVNLLFKENFAQVIYN
jgi:hypothetical protein